jgi:hypothetical protein
VKDRNAELERPDASARAPRDRAVRARQLVLERDVAAHAAVARVGPDEHRPVGHFLQAGEDPLLPRRGHGDPALADAALREH